MTTQHSWTLPGADGHPLHGDTHLPADGGDIRGVLLICHGFKGYKDYGLFPALATAAAARGLVAHRFNFSHSGMTNRIESFERPDLFEADTWGKQVHDLATVHAAARAGTLPGPAAAGLPITWFGHSRGGVTVLLAAAQATAPPARLVAAAAPHVACFLDEAQRRLLRAAGHLDSPSSRTGQVLRIGTAWLDELEADPEACDPLRAIGRLRFPVLLIHGADDQTVPTAAAHALHQASGGRAELRLLPGASHTFNAPNPLPDGAPVPEATQRLIDATIGFATGASKG